MNFVKDDQIEFRLFQTQRPPFFTSCDNCELRLLYNDKLIANSMAEVPALNLLAISAIEIPIFCNTELPLPDNHIKGTSEHTMRIDFMVCLGKSRILTQGGAL